jgi:membrane protein DedA with SNARE-associated domain
MFTTIETHLLALAYTVPLELFVFVASFIEEVFAPVPSAGVLLLAGSLATIQKLSLIELIPLILLAALGKTIGAIIIYYFSDKIAGLATLRFGGFFAAPYNSIKEFGGKITGSSRDYLILTVFRSLPIVPSSVVSVGCGVMKIRFKMFLITTLIGTIVRDSIFIYIGYSGAQIWHDLANQTTTAESVVQLIVVATLVAVIVYSYFRRSRQ